MKCQDGHLVKTINEENAKVSFGIFLYCKWNIGKFKEKSLIFQE